MPRSSTSSSTTGATRTRSRSRSTSFIDRTCVPAYEAYLGDPYDTASPYDLAYFYPDQDAWTSSKKDRTFTCYVVRTDGAKLTQSVKAGPAAS